MDINGLLASPAFTTLVGVLGSLGGVLVGGWLQRSHGKELERDRFRHEVAHGTAAERLRVHVALTGKVAEAYRAKSNNQADHRAKLDNAKNHYYDHRFFFSKEMGSAFRAIADSLGVAHPNRDILHENLNAFFNTAGNDLLLRDLADSVGRAVVESK